MINTSNQTPPTLGPQSPEKGYGRKAVLVLLVIFLVSTAILLYLTVVTTNSPKSVLGISAVAGFLVSGLLALCSLPIPEIEYLYSKLDPVAYFVWHKMLMPSFRGIASPFRPTGKGVKRNSSFQWNIILSIICVILIVMVVFEYFYFSSLISPLGPVYSCNTIPCTDTLGNQLIGISDGSTFFSKDSNINDVEQKIAIDNQLLAQKSFQYVTLIVLASLSSDSPPDQLGDGFDNLQGVYTLQNEADNSNSCPFSQGTRCIGIRVLIANAGIDLSYASIVVQQIESLDNHDSTLLGVVGWPESTTGAVQAIQQLSQATKHLLMVSATQSSDALTAISPYYFRMAPVDSEQGAIDANIAEAYKDTSGYTIHHAVVFYDDCVAHPYGRTLANAFIKQFKYGNSRNTTEPIRYNSDCSDTNTGTISTDIKNLQGETNPYMIFFAGYNTDFGSLLGDIHNLPPYALSRLARVLSGDAAYDLRGYNDSKEYKDFSFTTFAFPDLWGTSPKNDAEYPCNMSSASGIPSQGEGFFLVKKFFCDYANDFDPNAPRQHPGTYGFTRTDSNVMQAYDSVNVLFQAYLKTNNGSPNADSIRTILLNGVGSCSTFQGVTGSIEFGIDGNPINKLIVQLNVGITGTALSGGIKQGFLVAPCTWG